MSEIILNLSENSDNVCLSGEGQMVRGVGRLCRDSPTRVGGSTPVLSSGSVREGQVPLVLLHFSRQHCLTMHFTHTHPGSFIFPPKKKRLFYLSVLLMLIRFTTLRIFWHFYRKIWCNNLQFTAGETEAQRDEVI